MDEREWKDLLHEIAEKDAPGGVDLWPGIKARIQKRRPWDAFLRLAPRLAAAGALLAIAALFVSWLATLPRGAEEPAVQPDVTRPRAAATMTTPDPASQSDEIDQVIADMVGEAYVLRRFLVRQQQQAGPVAIAVHEVVFAEEGTYVVVEMAYPPRQQFDLMAQPPVLSVRGQPFEADYLDQNLNAGLPVALFFPVLPDADEHLVLTVPRVWALVDEPAQITLDLQQVGEGVQRLHPQTAQVGDFAVRFEEIVHAPQPDVGFKLIYTPVGEAAYDFHLQGPGSPNPQIRDDVGNLYQYGGSTLFDDEQDETAAWGASELRVTEPLAAEATQLTLRFEQTGRFYGPLTFEMDALREEPGDDATEDGTQTRVEPITAAQHGITLTLQRVDYGAEETRMQFQAIVRPPWTLGPDGEPLPSPDAGAFPPMPNSVMATMVSLQDEQGRAIAPRAFNGGPVDRDPAADAFTETFTLTFDAVPAGSRTLSLSVHLELHEPPADGPLIVDWESGQRLSTEPLSIAGVPLTVTSIERLGDGELRLLAPVTEKDGVTISCLHLYPPEPIVRDEAACQRTGDEIVSSLSLDPPPGSDAAPAGEIPFHLRGTVAFEAPWQLSWER